MSPVRWARLGATALLGVAVLNVMSNVTPVASAADCADAEVIFARGTDEPKGLGQVGNAFVDSLRAQAVGMNIATYAVNYDAGKLQLSSGDGAKDAIKHIKATEESCPNTKIVLGGYSQGANVINIVAGNPIVGIAWGESMPSSLADNVAAIATFGNFANRAATKLPNQSAMFAGKGIDLCNPADPICHAGEGNAWSGHTDGYVPGYTTQAATFAASKLMAGTIQTLPGFGQSPGYGQLPGYGPFPGYATPPSSSDHLPPGYATQTPDSDSSLSGYNPSVVGGLP